jgi:glutathione peroxidase
VNGANAHPLFEFLRTEKGGLIGNKIRWNFTKFLVDAEGNVVQRYGSTTTPESIADDIEALLPA